MCMSRMLLEECVRILQLEGELQANVLQFPHVHRESKARVRKEAIISSRKPTARGEDWKVISKSPRK
jgi:hypothetical protein